MTIFTGSKFIEKEKLQEGGIDYPIKLEYYKIIHEDNITKQRKSKFGIGIVKTEYMQGNTNLEKKKIPYLTNDETKIDEILELFKEHEVTPIGAPDILSDFSQKAMLL